MIQGSQIKRLAILLASVFVVSSCGGAQTSSTTTEVPRREHVEICSDFRMASPPESFATRVVTNPSSYGVFLDSSVKLDATLSVLTRQAKEPLNELMSQSSWALNSLNEEMLNLSTGGSTLNFWASVIGRVTRALQPVNDFCNQYVGALYGSEPTSIIWVAVSPSCQTQWSRVREFSWADFQYMQPDEKKNWYEAKIQTSYQCATFSEWYSGAKNSDQWEIAISGPMCSDTKSFVNSPLCREIPR